MSAALPDADEVLAFWFADPGRWWKKDPAFDAEVRKRFLPLHEAIDSAFPHRNAVLGRASTPEEEEFLKQPGSSF